jgi:hypothetical protein
MYNLAIYRVSINSFPDFKHLFQENYVEYKHIFLPLFKLVSKILCHVFIVMLQKYICISRSFVCNQGKNLCAHCTMDPVEAALPGCIVSPNPSTIKIN